MPPHLALTLINAPQTISPQTRTIVVSYYRLGRGDTDDIKVDWILPDDSRKISRLHCVLSCVGEDWCVTDVSSNGTFLNHEKERLEPNTTYRLMDGDHLQIGDYSFQVQIPGPAWAVEPHREMWEGTTSQAWSADPDAPEPSNTGVVMSEAQAAHDHRLLDRLLEGAGLSHLPIADPSAAMLRLGQALRAVITGLRTTRPTRPPTGAAVRAGAAGSGNPIDTADSDEAALVALMGAADGHVVEPDTAMRAALNEFAYDRSTTLAAMRHAVGDLLTRLSPDILRQQAERSDRSVSPLDLQRKARAWDAYEARYAQLQRGLSDDFEQTLGAAFSEAYEQLLQSDRKDSWRNVSRGVGR
jgi:predicted component of type VI protein secretion system